MKAYDLNDPEVLAKLPKGMQLAIQSLQSENRRLREERAAGPEDSDTFVSGGHLYPDQPLGKRPTINFGVKRYTNPRTQADIVEHVIDARWDDDDQALHVSAYNGTLQLTPWASNNIRIRIAPR